MTIRIIEQQDADGTTRYFAYHAHIVYHDNPDDDDFNTDNNHVVEVMAELPNPAALATWRDPMPMELAMAAAAGAPRPSKIVDVICPDPMCRSTTSYPSNGDPDARAVHKNYAMQVGTGKVAVPMSDGDKAILEKLARSEPLADGESQPLSATQRLHLAVHGVPMNAGVGETADEGQVSALRSTMVVQHQPIQPRVANDWALKDMGYEVPKLAV